MDIHRKVSPFHRKDGWECTCSPSFLDTSVGDVAFVGEIAQNEGQIFLVGFFIHPSSRSTD
jgi:hypothetical protein